MYIDTDHDPAHTCKCTIGLGNEYAFNFGRLVNSFLLFDKR